MQLVFTKSSYKPHATRTTRTPAFWDTPHHPMITYTCDSHQIQCQEKTKSKLQIKKNCQNFKLWNFARNFTRDTPSRTVGATERTRDAGRTDAQTEGRTYRRSETNIPPNNFVVIISNSKSMVPHDVTRHQKLTPFTLQGHTKIYTGACPCF